MLSPWNDSLVAPCHLSEWEIPIQFPHDQKNLQGILTTLQKHPLYQFPLNQSPTFSLYTFGVRNRLWGPGHVLEVIL